MKPGEWIIGGIIGSGVLPTLNNVEFLEKLDEASHGHPVLLRDGTMHNRQINTAAFEAMGITADSPPTRTAARTFATIKDGSPAHYGGWPARLPKVLLLGLTLIRISARLKHYKPR